jgi:hypothetical protein
MTIDCIVSTGSSGNPLLSTDVRSLIYLPWPCPRARRKEVLAGIGFVVSREYERDFNELGQIRCQDLGAPEQKQ